MLILNQGTNKEVALRVCLESDIYGREYFDSFTSWEEMLHAIRELAEGSAECTGDDGIERIAAIAVIPQCRAESC